MRYVLVLLAACGEPDPIDPTEASVQLSVANCTFTGSDSIALTIMANVSLDVGQGLDAEIQLNSDTSPISIQDSYDCDQWSQTSDQGCQRESGQPPTASVDILHMEVSSGPLTIDNTTVTVILNARSTPLTGPQLAQDGDTFICHQ